MGLQLLEMAHITEQEHMRAAAQAAARRAARRARRRTHGRGRAGRALSAAWHELRTPSGC